jgi:hypothetical protein
MARLTAEQKREIYDVIAQIYAVDGVGGALHIVLDDLNVEDHHITWCIEHMLDYQCSEEEQRLCVRCAELLLAVHKKQRKRLIETAHYKYL